MDGQKSIKFGLIGLGGMANHHLKLLSDLAMWKYLRCVILMRM